MKLVYSLNNPAVTIQNRFTYYEKKKISPHLFLSACCTMEVFYSSHPTKPSILSPRADLQLSSGALIKIWSEIIKNKIKLPPSFTSEKKKAVTQFSKLVSQIALCSKTLRQSQRSLTFLSPDQSSPIYTVWQFVQYSYQYTSDIRVV